MRYLWMVSLIGSLAAATAPASARDVDPRVVRVFYLQGVEVGEAMRLLRSEVGLRSVAALQDLDVLITSDTADRVDLGERLLVERDLLARSVEPHAPLVRGAGDELSVETRALRVDEGADFGGMVVVLRSIYEIEQLTARPEESTISVTASVERLDGIEAVMSELGVLD